MNIRNVVFIFLISPIVSYAASNSLDCKFKADPKTQISVGVDESAAKDTVLLGINMTRPDGTTKSALTQVGSLQNQIKAGTVIVAFGRDADPSASEIFDSALLAVTNDQKTGKFEGYLSVYDDGVAAMAITCSVK